MKVALIGYSGCGKSTLGKLIAEKYSLPIQHLDKVHWLPGWKERELEIPESHLPIAFQMQNWTQAP